MLIQKNISILKASFISTVVGTAMFFLIYGLFSRDQSPLATLVLATFAGGIGLYISCIWLHSFGKSGNFAITFILIAYICRILVGVFTYLIELDASYFSGLGYYANDNYEYSLTYQHAVNVADKFKQYGIWRREDLFPTGEYKNTEIHTWMGLFLASGDSRHSLDLAPFNSFHHSLAGMLIIALSLHYGHCMKVAVLAGVGTAWIPWAFPASLMWRDSVGIGWLVISIFIISAYKEFKIGLWGLYFVLVPAIFFAYSVREIYSLIVLLLTVIIVYADLVRKNTTSILKLMFPFVIFGLVFVVVFLIVEYRETIFHRHSDADTQVSEKIIYFPLLVFRALAGPFPWFGGDFWLYTFFDYLYHAFQLAILFQIALGIKLSNQKFKNIINPKNWQPLPAVGVSIWTFGVFASGVHTAYLALAIPFLLPSVFVNSKYFGLSFVASISLFLTASIIYKALGLEGQGSILNITGY